MFKSVEPGVLLRSVETGVLLRNVKPGVLFRNAEPGVLCVSACPNGLFGPNCRETCDCKTGLHCDPFKGCVGQ